MTSDLPELSLSEGKNHELSSSLPISECKDKTLSDYGVNPKQDAGKSQPDVYSTSRKRKSSDRSSGSSTKRKPPSTKTAVDMASQLNSSIVTSPQVSSAQEWTTIGTNILENPEGVNSSLTAEPLQSPDISSVEKDALLDSTPQMLSLELSNPASLHCMPTSKMSCHSQTMPSSTDNKNLASLKPFLFTTV